MGAKKWGSDLYIVSAPPLAKLGRSQHPQKRILEISRGCPWLDCKLWVTFPGAGFLEAGLHKELTSRFERHGEWYVCTASEVARSCVDRLLALEAVNALPDPPLVPPSL